VALDDREYLMGNDNPADVINDAVSDRLAVLGVLCDVKLAHVRLSICAVPVWVADEDTL